MAGITLREYVQEIEKQVDGKRTDEAIAHCHYLLQTYSKHVDIYRLLGKAFLESQRFGDAADIFQRVLSAIPDDFVSHVGMSIIREDEGNLDEAIWHMERAFDVQPSNNAIQEELRRMYGRRDNSEPPKIRLTRGALARLYLKGELHTQATAETRVALAETPDRLDLQALLAEIYLRAGQKADAAEMANQILRRLPYCLIANRILFETLSAADRLEEAKTYLQRLGQLDPYYAYVTPEAPLPDSVPDSAIRVEKLDWKVSQTATGRSGQPAWAASLGVDLGETGQGGQEPLPDWLSAVSEPSSEVARIDETGGAFTGSLEEEVSFDDSGAAAAPISEDQIPDWMKDLGWAPASPESRQAEAGYQFEEELGADAIEGELAAADMPDWLQEMSPEAGADAAPSEDSVDPWINQLFAGSSGGTEAAAPAAETEMPDWLSGETSSSEESLPAEETELPEWLQSSDSPGANIFAASATSQSQEPAEGLPDWLLAGESEPASEPSANLEGLPDWLQDSAPSQAASTEGEMPAWLADIEPSAKFITEETVPTDQPTADAGMPDWLAGLAPADETAEEAAPTAPAEGLPDWLLETAAETEAAAETPAAQADMPDWLAGLAPADETTEEAAPTAPAEGLPDWLAGLTPANETAAGEVPTEGLPDWLMEGSDENEQPATEPPLAAAGVSAWLAGLTAADEPGEEVVPAEPVESLPGWLTEETETDAPVERAATEQLPDWLSGLTSAEEVAEEAAPAEGLPDWLMEGAAETEAPAEHAVAEELPDWLSGLRPSDETAEETAEEPAQATASAEGLPDWLLESTAETEAATAEDLPTWLSEGKAPEAETPAEPTAAGELPDWLSGLTTIEEAGEKVVPAEPVEGLPDWLLEDAGVTEAPAERAAAEVTPDWLSGPAPVEENAVEPAPAEGLPDWLSGLTPAEETVEEAVPTAGDELPAWLLESSTPEAETQAEPAAIDELPNWLAGLTPTEEVIEEAAHITPAEGLPDWLMQGEPETEAAIEPVEAAPATELPVWLSETGAPEAEPVEATPATDLPDWLSDLTPAEEAIKEAAPAEEELPAWLSELPATEAEGETEPAAAEELPVWLSESAPVEAPAVWTEGTSPSEPEVWLEPSEPVAPPPIQPQSDELEDAFAWLTAMLTPTEEPVVEAPPVAPEPPASEVAPPAPPATEPASMPAAGPIDEDAAFAWLESLAVKQGASEALLLTPEERQETPPEWVQAAAEQGEAGATVFPVEAAEQPAPELPAFEPPADTMEPMIEAPVSEEPTAPAEPSSMPAAGPMDEDAAFAWLESLAVKQGASEALLLTPEERQEQPPEWVQVAAEEAEAQALETPSAEAVEPEVLAEPPASETPAPVDVAGVFPEPVIEETVEPTEPGAEIPPMDEDATFAWLESLAVKQGASEALLLTPEERQDTPPEWVQNAVEQAEAEAAAAPEEAIVEEAPGDAMEAALEPIEAVEPPAEAPVEVVEPVETSTVEVSPLPPAMETPAEEIPDLPDWLAGPEFESREEEPLEWKMPVVTRRRYDLNQASLIELERLPGIGFIMAQRIVDYREQHGPYKSLEDLLNIPDFTRFTLDAIHENLFVYPLAQPPAPAAGPRLPGTGPLPALPSAPEPAPAAAAVPEPVAQARELAAQGDWDQARLAYTRLIQSGEHAHMVIDDLTAATVSRPQDIELWQILGDAYLRTNQLKEAMQAYTQAEKLLR